MPTYAPISTSDWRPRTWRARSGPPRRTMTSEERMKRTWVLVAVIVSLLAGCKRNATPENALFVSGRIDGDTVDISSKIQGRGVNLTVREGDSVEAGQVIASLESAQQEAIRDAQKARIVSGQRTVDELETRLGT